MEGHGFVFLRNDGVPHVTANNASAQLNTGIGGKIIHMYKWGAGEALRIIEREKVTSLTGVPSVPL